MGRRAASVYGVNVQAGVGYRNEVTNGVATGSQPQGAYMVTSGTHVDNLCCFDFGNAETSGTDNGNGHMDAINFGTECWCDPPWISMTRCTSLRSPTRVTRNLESSRPTWMSARCASGLPRSRR